MASRKVDSPNLFFLVMLHRRNVEMPFIRTHVNRIDKKKNRKAQNHNFFSLLSS